MMRSEIPYLKLHMGRTSRLLLWVKGLKSFQLEEWGTLLSFLRFQKANFLTVQTLESKIFQLDSKCPLKKELLRHLQLRHSPWEKRFLLTQLLFDLDLHLSFHSTWMSGSTFSVRTRFYFFRSFSVFVFFLMPEFLFLLV